MYSDKKTVINYEKILKTFTKSACYILNVISIFSIVNCTKDLNRIKSHAIVAIWVCVSHHDSEVTKWFRLFAFPVPLCQMREKGSRVVLLINNCLCLFTVWSFNFPWDKKVSRTEWFRMSFQWVTIQWNLNVFEINDEMRPFCVQCSKIMK